MAETIFKFNKEQQKAIDNFTNMNNPKSVFVSASAGTGKTTMITEAYVKLLDNGIAPNKIVAITFTNNATNEMFMRIRSRVRSHIYESAGNKKKYWTDVYNQLGRDANISTIDTFASKLIKKYSYKLELLPNINIIGDDDEQNIQMIKDVISSILKKDFVEKEPKYKNIYSSMKLYAKHKKDSFIENIIKFINSIKPSVGNFENLEAQVNSLLKPDMQNIDKNLYNNIWASINFILDYEHKGSSKTLDNAKVFLNIHKDNIVDFDVIEKLYKTNTDESIEQLRAYFEVATILKSQFKSPQVKDDELKENAKQLKDVFFKQYYDVIFNLIFIIDYKEYIETLLQFLKEIFDKYEEQKIASNSLTFNDLISKAIELLKLDGEDKNIADEIRSSIDYLIIDETQDTNDLQYSLAYYLLFGCNDISEELLQDTDKVAFIVGDRKQSIYRFRNANISSFLNLEEKFKNSTKSESIYLNKNYRSEAYLIDFFNNIFSKIFKGNKDEIKYLDEASDDINNDVDNEVNGDKLISAKPQQPTGISSSKNVEYLIFQKSSDEDISVSKSQLEAHAVAYHISNKLAADNTLSYDKFAILLPVFTNLHDYIEALTKYDIPFYISSGKKFFSRPEIVHIINFLKYLVLKENQLLPLLLSQTFFDILESEVYIINKELLKNDFVLKDLFVKGNDEVLKCFDSIKDLQDKIISIRDVILELFDYAHFENASVIINAIISKTRYNAYLMTTSEAEFAYSNVEKFIEIAYSHEREQSGNNIYTFIESIATSSNAEERYASVPLLKVNAVTIMTVHVSKGLEFDNVVVGALSSGTRGFMSGEFQFIDEHSYIPINTDEGVVGLCKVDKDFNAEKQKSERRRLLYVALTRAKKSLTLIGEGNANSYKEMIENYYIDSNIKSFVDKIENSIFEYDYSANNSTSDLEDDNMKIYSYDETIVDIESSRKTNKNNQIDINDIEVLIRENYDSPKKIIMRASEGAVAKRKAAIQLLNIKNLLENKIAEHDEGAIDMPEIYENQDVFGDENTIDIMELGTLVHAILEIFDHEECKNSKDEYINSLVKNAEKELNRYANGKSMLPLVKRSLANYINSPHIKNILEGSEVVFMREHSFEKRVKDEKGNINMLRAQIDFVTYDEANDVYYIIDYKVSAEKNCRFKDMYKAQLEAYKDVFSGLYNFGKEKIITELMFLL